MCALLLLFVIETFLCKIELFVYTSVTNTMGLFPTLLSLPCNVRITGRVSKQTDEFLSTSRKLFIY